MRKETMTDTFRVTLELLPEGDEFTLRMRTRRFGRTETALAGPFDRATAEARMLSVTNSSPSLSVKTTVDKVVMVKAETGAP
jgi:hypothetical protein